MKRCKMKTVPGSSYNFAFVATNNVQKLRFRNLSTTVDPQSAPDTSFPAGDIIKVLLMISRGPARDTEYMVLGLEQSI
jgi:hypothetical protein